MSPPRQRLGGVKFSPSASRIVKHHFFCYYSSMTIQSIKRKIIPILKRQGVTKAAFFGSFARGEAKKNSDIDILVKLKKGKSLFDFVGLKLELEEKIGKKVDLLSYNGINHRLRNIILNEQKVFYGKRFKERS